VQAVACGVNHVILKPVQHGKLFVGRCYRFWIGEPIAVPAAGVAFNRSGLKREAKDRQVGRRFVSIDQLAATSKTCHCCGFKSDEMALNVRAWICQNRGTVHDRDINAALMVRLYGVLSLSRTLG
jgi:hypothetical protein